MKYLIEYALLRRCLHGSKQSLVFSEPSDDLNDLNFFNQKKKKKKPKKVFDNEIEESFKVWWCFFSLYSSRLFCLLIISLLSPIIDFFQELKIEGEQPEVPEEDNLDLMLPTKKKKSKKVEIDEGDALDKDDGKN